jgi:hypothetical protein
MKKKLINITFIIVITFITVIRAQAASSVTVFPSIISLVLSPGKTSSSILTVKNNGDIPLPVRLRFEPLLLTDDSSTLRSIGSWISLSKSSLLIPAQSEEKMEIKISIPKTIDLGGYYGMLYVEPLTSVQNKSGSLVMTKMGVLLLGSVGVQQIPLNSIEVQKPTLNSFISDSKTRILSYQVKNNALNHISAKPYVIIHPLGGKTETVELEERLIFPGKKRLWESPITVKDGSRLYYSADLFVSIGNGLSQKKSFSFIIFPIQQSIILVLCIAISISIEKRRKQIKEAIKILVKG